MKAIDVIMATAAAPTYFPHVEIEEGSAYVDGGLWANNPSMVAVVESIIISRKCRRKNIDPIFDLSTTYMLSIGTGRHPLYAKPPREKAGLLWWAANSVLDQTSASQSAGIDFQAKFVLQDRHRRVDFKVPDTTWTLDNASVVKEMIHIGQQEGVKDVEELRDDFFRTPATVFVPYEKLPPEEAA
jgi:patatin-like phospholipase/acyl hydrolase